MGGGSSRTPADDRAAARIDPQRELQQQIEMLQGGPRSGFDPGMQTRGPYHVPDALWQQQQRNVAAVEAEKERQEQARLAAEEATRQKELERQEEAAETRSGQSQSEIEFLQARRRRRGRRLY